ncbi:MAG TPA: SCO family protein [Polyangia bacterium]|jgi:protein SCO1/2|nr:SCO family protein [Polyangia bacterium]
MSGRSRSRTGTFAACGRGALAAFTLSTLVGGPARADDTTVPPALVGVDIIEHLGQALPPDVDLVDEQGRLVQIGDYFHKDRPILLSLVYYDCPMLCHLVLNGLVSSLKEMDLGPGRDFSLITVSFSPAETPAQARERQRGHLQALNDRIAPADWPFLTGREPQLRTLADAVGFRYRYDPTTRQYGHPAALFVLSPSGKITRYLYGVQFPARDLKLALLEAAQGRVGTTLDRVLLQCYRYDPASRRYGLYVFGFMRTGGALVLLGLALLLGRYWRRELRGQAVQDPRDARNPWDPRDQEATR